jgi:hypothetical protein
MGLCIAWFLNGEMQCFGLASSRATLVYSEQYLEASRDVVLGHALLLLGASAQAVAATRMEDGTVSELEREMSPRASEKRMHRAGFFHAFSAPPQPQ